FIGEGRLGHEVDAVGRKTVEEGGFPTVRHSVGHPIGRACHDSGTSLGPIRAKVNKAIYRPIQINEVYAIEPTVIQDDGLPCMLVEENVVITPKGAEILSRRQTQLYLIQG
ncbi:MAG: M24 family metallopeptidase, partial [Oscillospiraceae bacterium]